MTTELDYKDTIFLPTTDFPMRGNLPEREPERLQQWQAADLYNQVQNARRDAEKFIVHWGPPFANGHLHIGHVLSYTLKDAVVRSQWLLGKSAPSITGWDCHGLPIEWKVEEKYRAEGRNKDDVPALQFRQECRDFAQGWIDIQKTEMQRMGILADYNRGYYTMAVKSEALIAAELHKFLMNGALYRGTRPVMWSVVENTALAEAEIEYHEHTSTTIFVAFAVKQTNQALLQNANVVIWTTTPWTIPANRAVAVGNDITYGVYEIVARKDDAPENYGPAVAQKLVLATDLADKVLDTFGVAEHKLLGTLKGADMLQTICAHPLAELDDYYKAFDVPVLAGEFVTTETGTGIVHMAPSHGADDFHLCQAHNIKTPDSVLGDGTYAPSVALFAGLAVYDQKGKEGPANGAVIGKLVTASALMAKGKLRHSYPHSWRSKAPLIFRTTAQWFIDLDTPLPHLHNASLRTRALEAIDNVQWLPEQSVNRIKAMVTDRPNWCISRQRLWGVPIAIFVRKSDNALLQDQAVNQRIIDAFMQHGADAWYSTNPQEFLGADYAAADYEQIMDVVDVWFESGSTHAFVLEQWPEIGQRADLYLEGADQHRGWFQSSLLESVGTRGVAPFKQVLSHGFVVDEKRQKMSKSVGNVVAPADIIKRSGADILRLWALSSDYYNDVPFGQDVLEQKSDIYRRIRNTLRYMLGNLAGFDTAEHVDLVADYAKLPELEQWVLHELAQTHNHILDAVKRYDFPTVVQALHDFCNVTLSAFYFDIRKDRVYCDSPAMFERRATRSVIEQIFSFVVSWLTPLCPFTADEAWLAKPAGVLAHDTSTSAQMRTYPHVPTAWHNADLAERWEQIRALRRVVTGAIELQRANKTIGSSLEAHPHIYVADVGLFELAQTHDWAELAITSQATLHNQAPPEGAFVQNDVAGVGVVVQKVLGQKCARSWKILPDVGQNPKHPTLSARDSEAVEWWLGQQKP